MTTIEIDINSRTKALNKIWNMGFNTCHAPLLLRKDLSCHLAMVQELGFKYIRFHNIFSDEIGLIKEDEIGNLYYDFEKFDKIMDTVLTNNLLPFFEISFCPDVLKSSDANICHYKAHTSMPKSLEKWSALIKTVMNHIISRYGIKCVEKWYFEVWNEPDLPFFEPCNTEDYFILYDCTVDAIKSVSKKLSVGGPATSKCAWIDDFIKHVSLENKYCDFVSTHAYPSDVAFLNSDKGTVKLQSSKIMFELFSAVRKKMDNSKLKNTPLFMGEWNSSAGPYAYNHDEKNNAAFIVKTLIELENVIDGMLYWNLSDIYEEGGFHYTPFHGGYGMITVNSIPKSSYNAFKLLNKLDGEKLLYNSDEILENCGLIASATENKINILLYNYTEPNTEKITWNTEISMNIASKSVNYKSYAVNSVGGSSYEWWKNIESPEFITLNTLMFLTKKSRTVNEDKLIFYDNGYKIKESLEGGDIKLIELYY